MLVIEPWSRRYGDEKLASVCARTRVGHREFSWLVVPQRRMKFVAEPVAGIAGPRPKRAAALDHELRNHAMKNEAIVKRALCFLTGARVLKFLRSLRKANK